jgi:hypothetical protein
VLAIHPSIHLFKKRRTASPVADQGGVLDESHVSPALQIHDLWGVETDEETSALLDLSTQTQHSVA